MVLSWQWCPNRWSACPVSLRHLPSVRDTEPILSRDQHYCCRRSYVSCCSTTSPFPLAHRHADGLCSSPLCYAQSTTAAKRLNNAPEGKSPHAFSRGHGSHSIPRVHKLPNTQGGGIQPTVIFGVVRSSRSTVRLLRPMGYDLSLIIKVSLRLSHTPLAETHVGAKRLAAGGGVRGLCRRNKIDHRAASARSHTTHARPQRSLRSILPEHVEHDT